MQIPTVLALVAAAAGAGAAPAAAAPSLAPLKPCYVFAGVDPATGRYDAELVRIAAAGFAPGTPLRVVVDGTTVASNATADASGSLEMEVQAPVEESGERPFAVTVSAEHDPAQAAAAESRVTHLAVTASPRRARPATRVRFRGRGFTEPTAPVFAHYVRRGRDRRTVRLARRPEGACGTFSVRRRQFPFARPHVGRWSIFVDQSPAFRADLPAPQAELRVVVRQSPRL